jgi:glycosyltransferase involved in cell wall biosynthesis
VNAKNTRPLKVLIVTGDYSGPRKSPWIMDDLAEEFVKQGHRVAIMAIDTKRPWPRGDNGEVAPGIGLYSAGPTTARSGLVGKILGYVGTIFRLHTSGYRWAASQNFDLVVYTSIGLFSWFFPKRLRARSAVRRSAMVLWDFFPIQHIEIGRMGTRVPPRILKALERFAIGGADAVVVMTPRNVEFIRKYHPGLTANIAVAAPWSVLDRARFDEIEKERAETSDPGEFRLLWAGQMIEGRGLDVLFTALKEVEVDFPGLVTVVVGDGPKREDFEQLAESLHLKSVRFAGRLPRSEYRKMLTNADAGIAITVPNVSIPTFSAKISEFCAYGVPVIVSIENSSDAGSIVQDAGAGLASEAGDVDALKASLRTLLAAKADGTLHRYSLSARELFERQLSAQFAVDTIVSAASAGAPSN